MFDSKMAWKARDGSNAGPMQAHPDRYTRVPDLVADGLDRQMALLWRRWMSSTGPRAKPLVIAGNAGLSRRSRGWEEADVDGGWLLRVPKAQTKTDKSGGHAPPDALARFSCLDAGEGRSSGRRRKGRWWRRKERWWEREGRLLGRRWRETMQAECKLAVEGSAARAGVCLAGVARLALGRRGWWRANTRL